MILGLLLFFAPHTFTTKRDARAQAIARLGEGTYKILYAAVSFAG
ncbi:NnrU family protein, partial [Acinetobacter baumannii]